jgi:hypothetical protein
MTTKKTTPKSKRCPVCGEGELQYFARAGRTYAYKGFDYAIPASMKLVECTHCHEIPMTPAEVDAVEAPIANLHQQRMAVLVDDSLKALQPLLPIGQLESALHLSQGYLARARTKGEASFQLVALLKILAADPKKLSFIADLAAP